LAGAAVVIALLLCRLTLGRRYAYAPLHEPSIVWTDRVSLDRSTPSLNDGPTPVDVATGGARVGERVRVAYIATNEMYPPKFVGDVPGLPLFAVDARSDTYYLAHWPNGRGLGIAYTGASVEHGAREGDALEAEGVVMAEGDGDVAPFWLKAERVRLIRRGR
jgi:hypothetical protein